MEIGPKWGGGRATMRETWEMNYATNICGVECCGREIPYRFSPLKTNVPLRSWSSSSNIVCNRARDRFVFIRTVQTTSQIPPGRRHDSCATVRFSC